MGRKGNYEDKVKKGPGKKSRKQQDPVFPDSLKADRDPSKKLSSRQKKRAAKRVEVDVKREEKKVNKKLKKQAREMYESESEDDLPKNLLKTRTEALKVKKPAENGVKSKKPAQNGVKDKKPVKNVPKATVIKVQTSAGESEDDEEEEDDSDASLEFDDSDAEQGSDEEMEASSDEDNEPRVGKLNDLFADSDDEQAVESASEQSEASEEDEASESDEEDESDDDLLPIEKANKKLKQIIEDEAKHSKAELDSSMANKEAFEFPEETEETKSEPISLADVQIRIRDVIGVLSDFAKNRDPNRTRTEYLDLLRKDLCLYYSYNEFMMSAYMKIFPISELMEFLEASEVQRPLTIRTNTLKVRRRDLAQALINRGVNLDPVGKWSKIGLVVYSSSVPMGATPEYLSGMYMIQGASSMLPVMTLDPQENERILDMCAAPGGKSSHIAALMKNTGTLFSNDLKRDRIHGIIGNFHRLGVENSVVSCLDGTTYNKFMTGFDRVLLDAPCTGTGVVAKDTSVKTSKSATDVQRCYNLQRKLILTAIDCVSAKSSTGGIVVYSTCSILPEENEWVVDYALRKRNVRLVKTGLDFGVEGFTNYNGQRYHPTMKLTRRYYPHTHNMDGFFVAKLQKFSDAIPENVVEEDEVPTAEVEGVEMGEDGEMHVPKKLRKKDWYFEEIYQKRKKAKEDPNHVTKVFEVPVVNRKRKINKRKEQQNGEEPKEKSQTPTPSPKKPMNGNATPKKQPQTPAKTPQKFEKTPQKPAKTPQKLAKTPQKPKTPTTKTPGPSPKSTPKSTPKKTNKFEKKSPNSGGGSYKQFKKSAIPNKNASLGDLSMNKATKLKKKINANNKKDKVKRLQRTKPFSMKKK